MQRNAWMTEFHVASPDFPFAASLFQHLTSHERTTQYVWDSLFLIQELQQGKTCGAFERTCGVGERASLDMVVIHDIGVCQ